MQAEQAPATGQGRRYYPDLDGWRFVAFLGIFLRHAFEAPAVQKASAASRSVIHLLFGNANLAVNFFFVLSGFLITGQLLEEREQQGRINVGRFYVRRILRIWPLYFLAVLVGFVLWPLLWQHGIGDAPNPATAFWMYPLFLSNYDLLLHGHTNCGMLNILWSVSVEEQFYFIWPLLMLIVAPRYLWSAIVALIIGSTIYRFVLLPSGAAIRDDTLACMSDLALGGLAAILLVRIKTFSLGVSTVPRVWIAALYATTIAVYLFQEWIFTGTAYPLHRLVFGVLFAAIILEQVCCTRSLFKMRNNLFFRRMGKYTYGLYILHMPALFIAGIICRHQFAVQNLRLHILVQIPLALGITINLAWLSFRFFERAFSEAKRLV